MTDERLSAMRDVTAELDALLDHKDAVIRGLAAENQTLRARVSGGFVRAGWGKTGGARAPRAYVDPIADPSIKS